MGGRGGVASLAASHLLLLSITTTLSTAGSGRILPVCSRAVIVTVTDATQSSMRACTHTHAGNTCTCMTCIHIHEKREEREFGANFIPSQFCVHTVLCVRKDVYVHIHTRTHSFGVCLRCCHVRVSAMHVYTRMCAYTSCCD